MAQSAPTVDSVLSKMTIDQKIDYIGGTGFAIRAVPDLGPPALEMSDGPIGVRNNTGFPSTISGGNVDSEVWYGQRACLSRAVVWGEAAGTALAEAFRGHRSFGPPSAHL